MKYNFDYKKSLGQNFLIDDNIKKRIVDEINCDEGDLIIEIGPGSGAITKELIKKGKVLAFEIDERLKEYLLNIESDNLTIIFNDFLKVNLNEVLKKYKYNKIHVVGNLPYYITTAIISKIINEIDVYSITIMIQKEVANRFMANPCNKDYSSISVYLQYYFEINKVVDVSKNCFEPKPKVDSTVITMKKKNREEIKDIKFFNQFIKDAFQFKRKNLKNNLFKYDLDKLTVILKKYNLSLSNRAEEISVKEFVSIVNDYLL